MGTETGGIARAAVVIVVVGVVVVAALLRGVRTGRLTVGDVALDGRFVVGRVRLLDRFAMFASHYPVQKSDSVKSYRLASDRSKVE